LPSPAGRPAEYAQVRTAFTENGVCHRQAFLLFFRDANQPIEPFLQLFHANFPFGFKCWINQQDLQLNELLCLCTVLCSYWMVFAVDRSGEPKTPAAGLS
jgi:hypothetical protein